jgi:outer membrane immunogenic protein
MRKSLLVTVLLLSSGAAFSASATTDKPFEGWYVGGNLGYGDGDNLQKNNPDAQTTEMDGMLGGIQGGYSWHLDNNIVLAVEGGLSASDITSDWKGSDTNKYDPYSGGESINSAANLNFKLGYAFNNFLPYVTTGLTLASMDYYLKCDKSSVTETNGCKEGNFEANTSDLRFGANAGVGVAYKFSDNFSVGVEYMYTKLSDETIHMYDPAHPGKSNRDMETSFQTVTARVNYHF